MSTAELVDSTLEEIEHRHIVEDFRWLCPEIRRAKRIGNHRLYMILIREKFELRKREFALHRRRANG